MLKDISRGFTFGLLLGQTHVGNQAPGASPHVSPGGLERILDDHPEIEAVQIQFNYADMRNGAVQSLGCYGINHPYSR